MIRIYRIFAVLLAAGAAALVLFKSHIGHLLLSGNIHMIAEKIQHYGWKAIFLLFLAIFLQAFFPYMPFIVLAGVSVLVYGLHYGFLISWISTCTGASCAFLAARYIAREWAERKVGNNPYIEKFNTFARKNGFIAIIISRIAAVVPSSVINLTGGISRIRARTFILATFVGNFPVSYVESLLGHYLIHFEKHSKKLLVLLILLGIIVYFIKKRAKSNEVPADDEKE